MKPFPGHVLCSKYENFDKIFFWEHCKRKLLTKFDNTECGLWIYDNQIIIFFSKISSFLQAKATS